MKKKIMMICESFGGGVFAYVSQLCNDMSNNFEVYLVYSKRPQTPDNYKDVIDKRVHLIELHNFGNMKKTLRTIRQLKELEKEIKPNIIHLHSSIAGGIGRLAFNGKNNVVIYTPHGYAHILMGNGLKSQLYKMSEKILGKRNCITLTCCQSEDEEAKKFCKKTAYIETGVNLNDLSKKVDKVKPKKNKLFPAFTLGRICIQKQPKLFNEIARLVPEANFVWVGDGELRDVLTAPNITITGWKRRDEALSLAKGADVFILCSLGEAIAMSLLENMYMKKLCLVSNTMGNKSVINSGNNGYICNSANEYAQRIREAIAKFPHKLPERAHDDIVNIYNTEKMKRKYINFYNSICERSQ